MSDRFITMKEIENGLKEAGLLVGMSVEVHSSLSSFGDVLGGADTVIQALINVVGEKGSIVMPSFLLSPFLPLTKEDREQGITCKIRILPPDHNERSGMGVIADTFRKRSDVITGEGTFRVSAWGKEKEKNSQGFTNLIENQGFCMLLGVDIYRFSSMHYMEDHLPDDIKRRFQPSDNVRAIYPEQEWFVETWNPPVQAWYKIQEEAYKRGCIKDTMIGSCKCMSFRIKDVTDIYKEALIRDAYGLYGLA